MKMNAHLLFAVLSVCDAQDTRSEDASYENITAIIYQLLPITVKVRQIEGMTK